MKGVEGRLICLGFKAIEMEYYVSNFYYKISIALSKPYNNKYMDPPHQHGLEPAEYERIYIHISIAIQWMATKESI